MKTFGGVYLLCVPISHRTDGVINNKSVFHLNSGNSTYYCVKGVLHPIILDNTSLITVTLCCQTYYLL